MTLSKTLTTIFIMLSLLATQSWGLPEDSQQKFVITSDNYAFDFQRNTTTFHGNVVLQQGSLEINADKIIYYGKMEADTPQKTDKIVATGQPASFTQTPQKDAPPVTAVANKLEYSVKAETLFLIEDASLDQDGSSLSGNRIEYDVKKALVKASGKPGDNDSGRVRMVIPPKKFQTQADDNGDPESSREAIATPPLQAAEDNK